MTKAQPYRRLDWAFGQTDCRGSAKYLLICMAKLGNGKGTCFMSEEGLAGMLGVSVKTVQRGIRKLLASKLIFDVSDQHAYRVTKTYAFGCDGKPNTQARGQIGRNLPVKMASPPGQKVAQNLYESKKGITPQHVGTYKGHAGRSHGVRSIATATEIALQAISGQVSDEP